MTFLRATPFALLSVALFSGLAHAQQDNNVQWGLASHSWFTDRRPICPLNGETFDVIFQSGRLDLTNARVGIDVGADGLGITWVNAAWQSNRGPYDLWRATIPATAPTTGKVAYIIELTDGTDSDYLSIAGVTDSQPAVASWWTLDFTTLEHAPLGATPTTTGTVFRVWAPNATTCNVRGQFSNWGAGTPLTKRGEYFVGRVPNATANQEYKYYFNNNLWKPDPRARHLDNADSYNSTIIDPLAYQWQHPDFSPAPRDRWVVYQLHVGSFAGLNDPAGSFTRVSGYRDVGLRAQHLADLGVNAVMINPINEFPGANSGGYNPVTMWSFESSYGTPDDLKFMVDELHERGIAVILDVVWNHFSVSDNFLWTYDSSQLFFDSPAVDTPWGAQANFDRPQVRDYFLDSVEHVMGEFNLDGYRHDAVFEISGATQAVPGQSLLRAMMDRIRTRFAEAHVIGEIYDNSAWNTSPSGINLHAQYHEAYKNAIQAAIGAAALGDPDLSRLASSLDGSGFGVEGEKVLNYYELHDDAWPLNGNGARAVKEIDTTAPHDDRYASGRTKLGNAITILSRGMPAILQGTEWLEDNGWESQKIDWSHKATYADVFRFYKDLITLRTNRPALFANTPLLSFHVNDAVNVMAFERYQSGGGSFVVVANFSNTDYAEYVVGLPRSGSWGVLMNSDATIYRGRGLGSPAGPVTVDAIPRDGFAQSVRLALPAHSFLLLEHNPQYISLCDTIDFNRDAVFPDTQDVITFLEVFAGAPCPTCGDLDFNNDGIFPDQGDLTQFLEVFAGGNC
jgi:1,4-alpha-glucan branching enzyme